MVLLVAGSLVFPGRVGLHVGVEDVLARGPILAEGAHEGLFPRVGLEVHGEGPLAGRLVVAHGAGEGLLPAVGSEVDLHAIGPAGGQTS